jgi:hypothetical protein
MEVNYNTVLLLNIFDTVHDYRVHVQAINRWKISCGKSLP